MMSPQEYESAVKSDEFVGAMVVARTAFLGVILLHEYGHHVNGDFGAAALCKHSSADSQNCELRADTFAVEAFLRLSLFEGRNDHVARGYGLMLASYVFFLYDYLEIALPVGEGQPSAPRMRFGHYERTHPENGCRAAFLLSAGFAEMIRDPGFRQFLNKNVRARKAQISDMTRAVAHCPTEYRRYLDSFEALAQ
jgi:hypothetical protein